MGKTFTLKLFAHNDQASFAQAAEIALSQSRVALHTPGTLVQEPRRGGKPFLYWHRYTPDGKLEKQSIGPLGGAGEAAARQQIQELLLLRDTSKKLHKLGFAAVDNSTALALAVLYNSTENGSELALHVD